MRQMVKSCSQEGRWRDFRVDSQGRLCLASILSIRLLKPIAIWYYLCFSLLIIKQSFSHYCKTSADWSGQVESKRFIFTKALTKQSPPQNSCFGSDEMEDARKDEKGDNEYDDADRKSRSTIDTIHTFRATKIPFLYCRPMNELHEYLFKGYCHLPPTPKLSRKYLRCLYYLRR